MSSLQLACIVEGQGELAALPLLLRRVAAELDPGLSLDVVHLFRTPRSKLVKPGELERMVELAARRLGSGGALVILLDGDDDCPAELGPALLARAKQARPDVRTSVVVAHREFESWFLAAAESLRGRRGLADDLARPADPEAIRGAKEWLSARMRGGYAPTLDQPALAALFDLGSARSAASFDRFFREVSRLRGAGER